MTISEAEAAARALYPNTKFPGEEPTAGAKAEPQHGEKSAEAAARTLYPNTKFSDAPAGTKPEPAQDEKPAGNVPEAIAKLRADDPARGLYDITQHYGPAVGLEEALADAADVPAEVRAAAANEFKQIFVDHGLSAQDAGNLVSIARQYANNPPNAELQQAWVEQAEKRLREVYGKHMQEAVTDARRLVARDPRVAAILDHTRLGNHPEVIELMARVARGERLKGRL